MHSRLDCHKLWGCFASASSPSFLDPFLVREKWIEAEIENKKPPECCAVRMIKLDHGYCVSDLQKSLSSNHGIHSDEIILARSPMAVLFAPAPTVVRQSSLHVGLGTQVRIRRGCACPIGRRRVSHSLIRSARF